MTQICVKLRNIYLIPIFHPAMQGSFRAVTVGCSYSTLIIQGCYDVTATVHTVTTLKKSCVAGQKYFFTVYPYKILLQGYILLYFK